MDKVTWPKRCRMQATQQPSELALHDTSKLTIRRATVEDSDTIVSFNRQLAKEIYGKDLRSEVLELGVSHFLQNQSYGFYLLACDSTGQVVGQVAIKPRPEEWYDAFHWVIDQVFVDDRHRRCGVYRCLFTHVLELAVSASNVVDIQLQVHKDNFAAQQAYRDLGMEECTDILMHLLLTCHDQNTRNRNRNAVLFSLGKTP